MKVRILACPLFLLSLLLFLGISPPGLSQFRGGKGGSSGFSGGSFFFLMKDPEGMFERMAKGRDHFLISETFSLREPLAQFAKDKGISDDKISREQFLSFTEQLKSKLAPQGETGQASPGADPSSMDPLIAFEFRRRDLNGDGVLSPDEMPESLRQDLGRWDKNSDKTISLDEFTAYSQARLQDRADRADSAKPASGTTVIEVHAEDLDRRPVVYRAGKLPKELEAMFKELDDDEDGQITLLEWRKAGRTIADFKEMDRNDDGLLTPEEVLRFQNQTALASKDSPKAESSGSSRFGAFGNFFGGKGKSKGGFGKTGSLGGKSTSKPDADSDSISPYMPIKKPAN